MSISTGLGRIGVRCFNRQQDVLKGQDRRGHQPNTMIRFGDHTPAKVHGVIPAIFPIAVHIEDVGIRIYLAARPREALEMASRQHHRGEPLRLSGLNAADLGRHLPREPHE